MKREFQRFVIHCAYDLVEAQEIVESEGKIVKELMLENGIEFTIELSEELTDRGHEYYSLYLIVPKEYAEKVIELLDQAGGLGYEVDLDETLLVGEDSKELIYAEYEYNESIQEEFDVKMQEEIVEEELINEMDDEYTKGINKPKKTIIDYIIYLGIMAILVKLFLMLI